MSMESPPRAPNATIDGTPGTQSLLGSSDETADGRQPPQTIAVTSSTTVQPASNDQTAADGMAGGGNAQSPGDACGEQGSAVNSQDSDINADFEFLWGLRKYLLLLGVLAVSITYTAGLSPPGGFWTQDGPGHHAGDPLLQANFYKRYEAFFYFNATAFAASLVLIILLLSKRVASRRVWLRSMQATMVLDLFSLMGAYAAGSCRAARSSIYILVLVVGVVIYVVIHIVIVINVVPRALKLPVQRKLDRILSKCHLHHWQSTSPSRSTREEKEQIEEARKFILMLAIFAATVTYQAALSPPGGFWADNEHGHRAATSLLRYHYLNRYNAFMVFNATAFVASLVTIMLLLSTELSRHGIKSCALVLCVVVDLFALIGAYVAGCCRKKATSFYLLFLVIVVFVCFVLLVAFFLCEPVADWLDKRKSEIGRFMARVLSWPSASHRRSGEHGDGASNREHQTDQLPAQELSVMQYISTNGKRDSTERQAQTLGDSRSDNNQSFQDPDIQISELDQDAQPSDNAHISSEQGAPPIVNSNGDDDGNRADDSYVCETPLAETNQNAKPFQNDCSGNAQGAQHLENSNDDDHGNPAHDSHVGAIQSTENDLNAQPIENGRARNDQGDQNLENSNVDEDGDPRLKKSRTYLLLLAILAVSVTYQSGLNPPGGFWTKKEDHHSPGDPILEDTYHVRYITFFYFNATAFMASIVIIIMLLNKKMSNKAIKRRALQMAMIVDLLALMGSYVAGSWRVERKSIYIPVLIFPVIAYVVLHVLISVHVIPEGWKYQAQTKLEKFISGCDFWAESPQPVNSRYAISEKELERRRNLLLTLSVLAVTVTFQAGLNPPGGVWPDDGFNPGNPVLQDKHMLRYDLFYYSNAASFVSSVVIVILLINRESCEHGIKSYALRVCLVVGLLGLLIAYAAGSCRDVRSSIYLIVLAVAVLICLIIQVFLLSSTQDSLAGPLNQIWGWLQEKLCAGEAGVPSPSREHPSHNTTMPVHREKKTKRHKYLMLLAILVASITYQAALNPPGGFWSEDGPNGQKAANPVLQDINPRRYKTFFCFNAISFMASLVVIMLLLIKYVRKQKVPLEALHLIMILDLLALMTAYAAGSCRNIKTSIYVFLLVFGVVTYLVVVIILSSGTAKWLKGRGRVSWLLCCTGPQHSSGANSQGQAVANQV